MPGAFHIQIDPVHAIVRMTIAGFFELADVEAFATEHRAAYAALADRRGDHLTLCDVSDCKIQSQDVFAAFRLLLEDPRTMSRRLAFVTGVSPAKLQIRRLTKRETAQSFDDAASAERWLFAPGPVGSI